MTEKKPTRRRERRRAPRASARLSMRVEGAPDDGDLAQIVTESQNISTSGVYCRSPHYLPPLSKVALTIVLPRVPGEGTSQELIKCEGIVVRCEQLPRRSASAFELACMFSDLDADRRRRLENFVTWRNLQSLRAAARSGGTRSRTTRPRASGGSARPAGRRSRRGTVH